MSFVTHLDADAFFASVEQAADPRLRGKPIAVGGEKRGIVASASYEARRFGIYTPMPTVRARKLCPRLIVLPGDFEKYERFSRWMFSYAYDFTPDVEIGSIDEGYLDLTGARRSPVEIAATIRDAIRQALKITVSEGIGSSKLVSQIASKYRKPAAFEYVPPGGEISFLHPLPNQWLPGIGPKTAQRFNAAGLTHIRHIAATPADQLSLLVGRAAPRLREFANGIDDRPVVPASAPAKSYGHQETFAKDQTDEEFIEARLRCMADNLFARVRADRKSVRTLTIKVRYNDMDEDQCSESLLEPTDLETDVYGRLHTMLRRAWKRRVSLRLVSLKLSNLYNDFFHSELALDRAAQQHDARRRLAATVDALREEHGRYVVMRGHDFQLKSERRNQNAEPRPVLRVKLRKKVTGDHGQQPALSSRHTEARLFQSAICNLQSAFPLCVRSHYSFLNSTLSPEDIVALARRHGVKSIALCDQGNLHGAPEFAAHAMKAGIQPIFGAEIRTKGRPLRLYVENSEGYANLCQLLSQNAGRSQSDTSSFYTLPSEFQLQGLLAISPSPVLAQLFPGRFYLSVSHPDELRHLNNPDHLPVVVLHPVHYATPTDRWKWDILQSIRTLTLLRQAHPEKQLADEFHFRPPRELAELFREHPDVLERTYEIAKRCSSFKFPFGKPQFPPFRTPDGSSSRDFLRKLVLQGFEARYGSAQGRTGFQPVIQSTARQAQDSHAARLQEAPLTPSNSKAPGEFEDRQDACPAFTTTSPEGCRMVATGETRGSRDTDPLRPEGAVDLVTSPYPSNTLPRFKETCRAHEAPDCVAPPLSRGSCELEDRQDACPTLSRIREQVETELQIIHDVGYEDYFLIVWGLLGDCRAHGIDWITRGSAADSLVCYCLGISNVCPIRFELYFRRFLNQERMALNKLPDIDIDFPHDRKDDVVDLLFAKYGPQHCAVVGGFSTFRARSAFAEVAKVLGVAERDVRRFTEHFPWSFGGGWETHAQENRPRARSARPNNGSGPSSAVPSPKSEVRSPTRCDGATARREEAQNPKPESNSPCISVPSVSLCSKESNTETRRTQRDTENQLHSDFGVRVSPPAPKTEKETAKDEERGRMEGRLAQQLRARPETADLPLDEEPYRSALLMAEFLDGMPRYPKMHPCGVVLSRQPVHELTPTFVSQKGWPTTHYDMDAVGAIGLVKMDILAQGGLAAMRDTQVELAKRNLAVDLERFEVRGGTNPKSEVRGPKEARTPNAESVSVRASVASESLCSNGSNTETRGTQRVTEDLPCSGFGHSDVSRNSHFAFQLSHLLVPQSAIRNPQFNDPEVWTLIASGNARAVHHIESPAMISLCRMTNVRDIDTLIAIVSVIRPGAANEDKKREFTRRYQGLSPITYPHPSLEPCLKSTFGLVVYEEHILQICEAFAGLPGGRADVLRRALVKENWLVVEQVREEFMASARRRGHSDEDIVKVWQLVEGFHGYAFCKAHSTAYGVEAYQSAWLKRHFPAEFMAAVLTNGKGFYRPLVYVLECWRLEIGLLPPTVNEPGPNFVVVRKAGKPKSEVRSPKEARNPKSEPGALCVSVPSASRCLDEFNAETRRTQRTTESPGTKSGSSFTPSHSLRTSNFGPRTFIRVPVTYIASLTERTKERILAERERKAFSSLTDFYLRVKPSREEFETLSRAGALDEFGQTRCEQFWEIQQLVARWGGSVEAGQAWLLPPVANPQSAIHNPPLTEPSRLQRLQWEAELLGFPASGHPLELYPDIAWDTYCPVSRLGDFIGEEVTLCGLVIEDRVHHQVTGEPMKFLTLCDWTGMVETELFAATYRSHGLATVRYPVLEVSGRVEAYENGRGHSLRVLRAGKPRTRKSITDGSALFSVEQNEHSCRPAAK